MEYIRAKLKRIPKPLISTLAYMFVVFFQNGVNLLTTPIFSRLLSTSDYGIVNTYSSWYNIFSIIVTLNLSSGVYNNALIDFENKREKVTSAFLTISIILTAIFLIVYIIFKNQIIHIIGLSEYLIDFMFINFLTAPAWGFFIAKEKYDYKYIKPLIITVFTFILNPVFGFVGIKLFPNNKAVAKVICCGLPTVIVNIVMLIKILFKGKTFFNREYWKYALSFNIPLVPHYLSNIVLASSDRIMIQKMVSNSAAGIYGVSYNLSQVIQGFLMGINSAWIPFTYKNLKNNNCERISKYSNLLIVVIGVISIILSFFAPEIIKILSPEEYYSAVWVIPPIIIGIYLFFISSLFGNVEFYYKKNIFVMLATSGAAIINVILNAIFIPKYGFIVAGYTTAIGYLILAIAHYLFLKKLNKHTIYNIKKIVIYSIPIIGFIELSVLLYTNNLIRWGIICGIFIISIFNAKKIIKYIKNEYLI